MKSNTFEDDNNNQLCVPNYKKQVEIKSEALKVLKSWYPNLEFKIEKKIYFGIQSVVKCEVEVNGQIFSIENTCEDKAKESLALKVVRNVRCPVEHSSDFLQLSFAEKIER